MRNDEAPAFAPLRRGGRMLKGRRNDEIRMPKQEGFVTLTGHSIIRALSLFRH